MMTTNWQSESADGKISKLSSSVAVNHPFCSIGDKPKETSKCSFEFLKLEVLSGELCSQYVENNKIRGEDEFESFPPVTSTLGISCVTGFDRLVDNCLMTMVKDEIAGFQIQCIENELIALISLKLNDFEDGFCELFERTPEDLIYLASQLKSEGVQLYKEKRMNDAFSKFSKACKFLILIDSRDTESSVLEQRNQLLATLYSNLAGCHVVSKNWNDAIWLCDKVLLIQKSNVKALFRRGISYIELQEFEKARSDLLQVKQLEPNNSIVKTKLAIIDEKEKVQNQKYASAMKKMFE